MKNQIILIIYFSIVCFLISKNNVEQKRLRNDIEILKDCVSTLQDNAIVVNSELIYYKSYYDSCNYSEE